MVNEYVLCYKIAITRILAPNRFLKVGQFNESLKCISDAPLLPWEREFGSFNTTITRDIILNLAQTGGFRVHAIYWYHIMLWLSVASAAADAGVLLLGYQRELTYQHDDGSFSAFGNNDPSGSMWLVQIP